MVTVNQWPDLLIGVKSFHVCVGQEARLQIADVGFLSFDNLSHRLTWRMDVIRLFFGGVRKYITISILLAAGYAVFAYVRKMPREIEVALTKTTLVRTVYGLGTVQAENIYQMKIGIAADIRNLYVKEGDLVKKGQKLVDFADVPPMRSPINGIVSNVYFKEGESVFPQNPVLKVMDLSRRYILVSLDEKAAVLVRKAQKVRIALDSLPGTTFSGLVTTIYPSDGQFMVKVDAKDLPPEVLPGMSADLAIEAGQKPGVFVAPIRAVREGKINIHRGGKKFIIPVQLGLTQGDNVEIISSQIAEGDMLIYRQ